MTPARRHNPLTRIPDDVIVWLAIVAVILAAAVPATLDALERSLR